MNACCPLKSVRPSGCWTGCALSLRRRVWRLNLLETDLSALEWTTLRMLDAVMDGSAPGFEASVLTLRGSTIVQAIAQYTVDVLGAGALPFDPAFWHEIADLGWLAAGVSEAAGGFGGPREVAVVMQGVGATALADQIMPVYLALAMLEGAGAPDDLLAGVIAGMIAGQDIACAM
ncbi:MAG: hypothetical protein ACNA7Q_15305 [Rhodobacterales bacterium]